MDLNRSSYGSRCFLCAFSDLNAKCQDTVTSITRYTAPPEKTNRQTCPRKMLILVPSYSLLRSHRIFKNSTYFAEKFKPCMTTDHRRTSQTINELKVFTTDNFILPYFVYLSFFLPFFEPTYRKTDTKT